jgi:hypothetical protein
MRGILKWLWLASSVPAFIASTPLGLACVAAFFYNNHKEIQEKTLHSIYLQGAADAQRSSWTAHNPLDPSPRRNE